MLRRKLGLRMDDQKELRVKPVPTWCTKHSHMASAKARRTRIATRQSKLLPSRRRRIKRRMRVGSCAVPRIIGQKKCPNSKGRKPKPEQKTANMVASTGYGTSGYGNLPSVLSVFQSSTWWLESSANIHVCSNVSLFSSYRITRDSSVIMGNESHASVHGVAMIDLKLTLEKIM
jgi:transposase InsO family protein